MDNFIDLYSIYESITRRKIIARIYKDCGWLLKSIMWISKIAFVVFAAAFFTTSNWHPLFLWAMVAVIIWGCAFALARKRSLAAEYAQYSSRIKQYDFGYQYIRFLGFYGTLVSGGRLSAIDGALNHLQDRLDTESSISMLSNAVLASLMTIIVAVVGGAAGQWSAQIITTVLMTLAFLLYFAYSILALMRTGSSNLKEFRRFLLWAKEESRVTTTAP